MHTVGESGACTYTCEATPTVQVTDTSITSQSLPVSVCTRVVQNSGQVSACIAPCCPLEAPCCPAGRSKLIHLPALKLSVHWATAAPSSLLGAWVWKAAEEKWLVTYRDFSADFKSLRGNLRGQKRVGWYAHIWKGETANQECLPQQNCFSQGEIKTPKSGGSSLPLD